MIRINLSEHLHKLGLTNNKLAVMSSTRPNTIADMTNGKAQRIDLETLDRILNTLNQICVDRKLGFTYQLTDIIVYEYSGQ